MSSKLLPAPLRARMERAFGADFSAVTVHEDGAAGALGAEAYARGDALHFAPGRYDPATPAGEELIAHELAHVVQQRRGRVAAAADDGDVNGDLSLEREADQLAATAVAGGSAHVAHGTGASGAGTAIQAKFVKSTSYRTRADMPVLTPYGDQEVAQVDAGTNFECVGGLAPIPRTAFTGYRILSRDQASFVAKAVADDDVTYWEERELPAATGRNSSTVIADWDVGEADVGGAITGVGEQGTTLRTTVKWGPVVDGPGGFEEGTWMEATCLGPDHPTGSENTWPVGSVGAATGITWVGGHLLNDHLGGPGNDPRNIVAIPGKNTNCHHESHVEDEVKAHVNKRGGWAYYKVEAIHESRPIAKTRRSPRADEADEEQDAWQRVAGRTHVNIATRLNTTWYRLDALGRQAGPAQHDSFPIPDPLTIAGVSTAADNEAAWHEGPDFEDGPDADPFYSPRFLRAPVHTPSTGHADEYGYLGHNAEDPSNPWARRAQIEPVVESTFVGPETRQHPPWLMTPTVSLQDMLRAEDFIVEANDDGELELSLRPPPKVGQLTVRQRAVRSVGRHIKQNPAGVSSTLARGVMTETFVDKRADQVDDPEWGPLLATLRESADLQAWQEYKDRRNAAAPVATPAADDSVGTSTAVPARQQAEQDEDDEESEQPAPRRASAAQPRRKRRRVTVKSRKTKAASGDQPT